MQSARRVANQKVRAARARSLAGIKDHRSRVGTRRGLDHFYARSLRPSLQLLNGSRTKGIGSGEQNALSVCLCLRRHLTGGRRFAHAVHADQKQNRRLLLKVIGVLSEIHSGLDAVNQKIAAGAACPHMLRFGRFAQFLQNLLGCAHAHIAGD